MVRIAAILRHARFDVGVECLALVETASRAEDHFGRLGGELATWLASAGLHDHGPTLHRPCDIERAAHCKVRAAMVKHMELGGLTVVTMFQRARPSLVWSRLAKRLETWNGSS